MVARAKLWLLTALVLTGCAVYPTPPVERIALLAPFEGHTREIGYQALYGVRMALSESGRVHLELVAVDDGGSLQSAQDRARALHADPLIQDVLLLGDYATTPDVYSLLRDDQPHHIIGQWHTPADIEANDLHALAALDVPFVCGDMCTLDAFVTLADDLSLVTIETDAPPVTDDFRERYTAFDTFAPKPLPIAQNAYAVTVALLNNSTTQKTPHRYTYRDEVLQLQSERAND